MARRKTINVEDLKDFANNQLASSVRYERQKESFEGIDAELRKGVMMMLENVLMSTDNYKGFRYLAIDEVPTGCTPGIRRDRGQEKQFDNTDNTRVRYF
tara:strand:+ start:136 stop:432 length:297 start_codon:yes stop_codon:yes gene_type:complete